MGIGEQFEFEKTGRIDPESKMTEPKFEPDKFIVINRKRFDELDKMIPGSMRHIVTTEFLIALKNFKTDYEVTGRELDQSYYVCNQDEPYAEEVKRVILEGEREKTGEVKKLSAKEIENFTDRQALGFVVSTMVMVLMKKGIPEEKAKSLPMNLIKKIQEFEL